MCFVVVAAALGSVWCLVSADEIPRAFPTELVDFGPVSSRPLFAGGGADAWDRDLRERGWIVRDATGWHLWYTGSNPGQGPLRRLGHATSRDGLNWRRVCDGPALADRWVEDVCIVQRGCCAVMFAEGERDIAHLLVSRDRRRWEPCGPLDIRLTDGAPIPAGPRGTPTAWFEHGVWHLFYERMDKGVWLATSRDLRTFTNRTDDPVLTCGPDAYDAGRIAVDQILRHNGRYYAYYHASPRDQGPEWNTCIATSLDLVHWEKYAGNPVLPVDPEAPSRSSAMLVFDGRTHRLYTTHPDVRVCFSVTPAER